MAEIKRYGIVRLEDRDDVLAAIGIFFTLEKDYLQVLTKMSDIGKVDTVKRGSLQLKDIDLGCCNL